jgi:rare lipoprotein A (peptidoglycan hydrolase)
MEQPTYPLKHTQQVRPAWMLLLLCFGAVTFVSCASSTRFTSGTGVTTYPYLAGGSSGTRSTPANHSTTAARPSTTFDRSSLEATTLVFFGGASYYGDEFQGRRTSNGEIYNRAEFSAAHRTLPFGTVVRVRNVDNNRSVLVRINDRGPFKPDRVIDVSRAAADELGMVKRGTASVEVTVMRTLEQ